MFVPSVEPYFLVFNSIISFGRKDQLIQVCGPSDSKTVSGLQPGFMAKYESTKALDYAWPADTVIHFVHIEYKKILSWGLKLEKSNDFVLSIRITDF